jgi:glycosyltransferase involved in cell wall biosynthesis
MNPLFSIITPTYNCGPKLHSTLESVQLQDFKDFEYLIIDGNSRDGTKERLAGIGDSRVRSLSEPDKGIYDAMNKGVKLARGKYLLFLGAGDQLLPGVLRQISQYLPKEDLAVLYGNVLWGGKVDEIYDGEFSKLKLCSKNICHQAIFYTRNVFNAVGDYDLEYPALADWVLNMKCFGNSRIKIRHVPIAVSTFELGGCSGNGDPGFDTDRNSLIWRHLGMFTYWQYKLPHVKDSLGNIIARARRLLRPFIPSIILRTKRKMLRFFFRH